MVGPLIMSLSILARNGQHGKLVEKHIGPIKIRILAQWSAARYIAISAILAIFWANTYPHWVPRVVQDLFQMAPADILTKELPEIMKLLIQVADDDILKTELLESIPNIAAQAIENSERVAGLKDVVGDYLIPLVVRSLGCFDLGFDQKAQATLIQMIERGYISKCQAEIKVCPSVLALTKVESQLDVNTRALMLMSKLASLLGRDITERIFLKRFKESCSSNMFYIRKLSASHIGHYCSVVGKDAFEKTLLPCYLTLCQDEIWGVRKSCAEVIMFVSCVCPADLRKSLLATAFVKLLQDECRWVRMSAFQTLGAFITTFADPALISIGYNMSGDLVMFNKNGGEFQPGGIDGFSKTEHLPIFSEELPTDIKDIYLNEVLGWDSFKEKESMSGNFQTSVTGTSESVITEEKSVEKLVDEVSFGNEENSFKKNESNDSLLPHSSTKINNSMEQHATVSQDKEQTKHEDDLLSYNEYNYWYINPPDVELQGILEFNRGTKSENLGITIEDIMTKSTTELFARITLDDLFNFGNKQSEPTKPSSDNKGDNLDNKSSDVSTVNSLAITEIKEPPQNIVPQELIDHFLSMAHCEISFCDSDMPFNCAYSLPAVILTLGKENWALLKNTVDVLAENMSYRIRRTVASSLHEIAFILGPELATEHLFPLFEGFLKDLDEVRIGILNNLFHFLQLITPEKRATFLPKLGEFMRVDDAYDWRFHEKVADQLKECVHLFQPVEMVKHIGLCARALMSYKVAAVRQAAISLVITIVKQISEDRGLTSNYLLVIAERFAHSKKWKPRQTFAILCTELLKEDAIDLEEFSIIMLPHLLDLSWDPIANVRLVVARCIVKHIIKKEYFANPENGHLESLHNVLRRLQADKDRDVRMSADLPLP